MSIAVQVVVAVFVIAVTYVAGWVGGHYLLYGLLVQEFFLILLFFQSDAEFKIADPRTWMAFVNQKLWTAVKSGNFLAGMLLVLIPAMIGIVTFAAQQFYFSPQEIWQNSTRLLLVDLFVFGPVTLYLIWRIARHANQSENKIASIENDRPDFHSFDFSSHDDAGDDTDFHAPVEGSLGGSLDTDRSDPFQDFVMISYGNAQAGIHAVWSAVYRRIGIVFFHALAVCVGFIDGAFFKSLQFFVEIV